MAAVLVIAAVVLARLVVSNYCDEMPEVYRWLTVWDGKVVLDPVNGPRTVNMIPSGKETTGLVICMIGDLHGTAELLLWDKTTLYLPDAMKRVQRFDWYGGESIQAKYVPGKHLSGNLTIFWKFR